MEHAFQGRAALAATYAAHIDATLGYIVDVLEADADALILQPGTLSDDQRGRLAGLRRRLGPAASLTLATIDGTVLWDECGDPCGLAGRPPMPLDRAGELTPPHRRISDVTDGTSVLARVDVPLVADRNRVDAVLVAEVDPRHPSLALLPHGGSGPDLEMILMTADGRFIAGSGSPTGVRVPGADRRAAQEHARLFEESGGPTGAGYRVHDQDAGRPMSGHVVAYAPLAALPSWVVTVEQPVDRVLALPSRILWYLAVFCGATLAFVMTLAFFDVRRITAPVRRLTAASERLAAGLFDVPVGIGGTDELGDLARAFESMRVQLRDFMERERNVAVLEERERIAGEMHDGLGQVLGYVIMKSLAVAELIDRGNIAEGRAQIDQLEAAAREAYADVRENILALRTTLAPGRGLLRALRDYAAGFERQSGIAVELVAPRDEGDWIEPPTEVQLLRIVQEALANVRKHAEAHRVTIQLAIAPDRLRLEVVDDGRGFDPSRATGSDHFGLQMMRERAEGVGGTFSIVPVAGDGTQVTVTFPRRQRGATDGPATHTPRR